MSVFVERRGWVVSEFSGPSRVLDCFSLHSNGHMVMEAPPFFSCSRSVAVWDLVCGPTRLWLWLLLLLLVTVFGLR